MPRFRVAIHVVPRAGILDPQGKAVREALHALGFPEVADAHVGRHLVVDIDATSADAATEAARRMCDKLLANPVTEDYDIAGVTAA